MSGHHHVSSTDGDLKIFLAVFVNLVLTLVQVVGGILSGSLALIADAIHNLSDALALIIAFIARKIARRPANAAMTFGYGRAEIVAALVNYTTLILMSCYLLYEAAWRFIEPQRIDGWLVVVIAGFALIVDLVTAALTFSLAKKSMNIRAAFLHNISDALGSVAVILAGAVVLLFDWRLIDPLITVFIASYILWLSFREVGAVIRVLMLAAPSNIDVSVLLDRMMSIDGVSQVHHLHVWQMQEHQTAVDAHIVVEALKWPDVVEIKDKLRMLLKEEFAISHTTLETEAPQDLCLDALIIGHASNPDHSHSS